MKSNLARLKVTGVNVSSFINNCTKNDIELRYLRRCNTGCVEFSISDDNLKKLNALNFENAHIDTILPSKSERIKHFLLYRMGLIIGLIFSIVLMIFLNNRLVNITIIGLDKVNEEEIVSKINEFGINKFSDLNFDKSELAEYLEKNFDFSLVSIITKGNSLIINIKESLPDISDNYIAITSDYNMIITEINVYSGSAKKGVGDIVYVGDILVEPYEIIGEEKIDVVPCADVKGDVYFSSNYKFENVEEKWLKTGEKQILEYQMSLGEWCLYNKNYECEYENYEVEEIDNIITSYFLPIHIKKKIVYETHKETFERNFEEEKDEIIRKLKDDVYSKVPQNINIDSEDIKINSTKYGNIVTIYLKSSVYLKYNNN